MNPILQLAPPMLKYTPTRWQQLVQSFPDELLGRQPAAGEWSAGECLQHTIDTEHIFRNRIEAFLEGKPGFPAFDPDREGAKASQSWAELADCLVELRKNNLLLLQKVTPDDLDREAQHQELGTVTLGELLNEWVAHDLNHLIQAERALMQPFIQNCGAWQKYFVEHLVK